MNQYSRLNITDEEYNVYVFLLANPGSSMYAIAKGTGIPRSTVYSIIEQLENKGLAQRRKSKRKVVIIPTPPQELLRYAQSQKDAVEKQFQQLRERMPLLDFFVSKSTLDATTTQFYDYTETEISQTMHQIVGKAKSQMYGLSNHHWINETFAPDQQCKLTNTKYVDLIKRVGDRFAFTGDEKSYLEALEFLKRHPELRGKWEPRWIDHNKFEFDMNINTFDDVVTFSLPLGGTQWKTLFIRNAKLAHEMQNLCRYLWETAKPIK